MRIAPMRIAPMRIAPMRIAMLVAVAGAAASMPAGAQGVPDTTLANGLQVYVIENHAVPIVTATLAVRGGASVQDTTNEGVANLFMSTPPIDEGRTFTDLTAAHGSYTHATRDAFTSYVVTVPAPQYGDGIAILERMANASDWNGMDMTAGVINVAAQLQHLAASPEQLLQRAAAMRLWGPAWPQRDVVGLPQIVTKLGTRDLAEFHRRLYVPNNMALVVSGDVTPSAVFTAARRAFDGWRRGPDPLLAHPIPPTAPLAATDAFIQTGNVSDVTVDMQWRGPRPLDTPDLTYAADIFTTWFNDPSSRIQRYLVESGLFQSLAISYRTARYGGPIEIIGHTSVDSLPHALAALRRELAAAGQPGAFDDNTLVGTRRRRVVDNLLEIEQANVASETYAFWWADAGPDYIGSYVDRLQAVTADNLRTYVNTYLAAPCVIGVLGPDKAYPTLSFAFQSFVADSVPAATGVTK
jgi:zinc protease